MTLKEVRASLLKNEEKIFPSVTIVVMSSMVILMAQTTDAATVIKAVAVVVFTFGASIGYILRDYRRWDRFENNLQRYSKLYSDNVEHMRTLCGRLEAIQNDPKSSDDCNVMRENLYTAIDECRERMLLNFERFKECSKAASAPLEKLQ